MLLDVVIMAAGKGTRMKSARPKVLHALAGRPLLQHVLQMGAGLGAERLITITGHGAELVERTMRAGLPDAPLALRRQRRLAGVALSHLGVEVGYAGAVVLGAEPAEPGPGAASRAPVLEPEALVPLVRAARRWPLAAVGRSDAALH